MSLFRPDFDLGPYTFADEQLREIAFPLGGIGTGCVSLDGRLGLRDWEIYGRPNKGSFLEKTFPALWVQPEGEQSHALTVQGPRAKDWVGEGRAFWSYGHGQFFKQMDGLPGFDAVEFCGTFPMARARLTKKGLPVEVELAAFNPFIPLDTRSSSFPCACLVYRVKNLTRRRVRGTLAWSLMNPIGEGVPGEDRARNETRDSGTHRGLYFFNEKTESSAALTTAWKDVTILERWETGAWFDAVQTFWSAFREDGRLEKAQGAKGNPRSPGTLGCVFELGPGEEVEIPFLISWVVKPVSKYWGGPNEPKAEPWNPSYSTLWPTAWHAATEFHKRYEELSARTLAFERAMFQSTLPPEVLQSVSATASTLHSPTVIQLEDGTFWAWEGCSPTDGCCAGTCSHVWNYALTHAHLFPTMQHSMRRTEYRNAFNCGPEGKKGALNFRVMIPLGAEAPLWHAASDGQLGGVVQLYRDWRLSGDRALLEELWPSAKKALEYAWVMWDRDRDGLVEGDMHNTYDINFQSPNPLTQFFYLAALRAGEEMARETGDEKSAATYRELYVAGKEKTEKTLWNGQFFIQLGDFTSKEAAKYQHGKGCLSDQLFGQLLASLAGLGHLVDPYMVRLALQSVFRYNFRAPLGDHENLQRVYAVSDEAGLLLCSWPEGGRPAYPFVYSDEVWTGIEYQVATHLALEGLVDQALAIVRGVRERYDGVRRNPWNEFECGSHYARALASYGLMLALSGFRYDAVSRSISLDPRVNAEKFQSFFCTPHGWGVARMVDGKPEFEILEGELFANSAQ